MNNKQLTLGKPEGPTESAPDLERVREALRGYLADGHTQTEVAKRAGLSTTAVSQFLADRYAGDAAAVARKLADVLELESRRSVAPTPPAFVRTSIAEEVLLAAEYAHVHRTIGLVYGGAGLGKTMALKEYARQHRDTIMITADPTCRSAKGFTEVLLEALGKREYESGTLRQQVRAIVEILRDSGRLVIIDEAQHLSERALETVRSIHDQTGCGTVMAGNDLIWTRMIGHGGGSVVQAAFAQMFSRVGVRRCLRGDVGAEDVALIIRATGVSADQDTRRHLTEVANTPGGIRQMVWRLLAAATTAYGFGRPAVTMEDVRAAERQLLGIA